MSSFDPTIDATFREYVDWQLRRHLLLLDSQRDEAELDDIEDHMDILWERLDETQRRSVRGMSSDLNWILRKGKPPPKGRAAHEVTPAERQELLAARKLKEWHEFLHYLRVCASTIPPANLAYLRAMAYDAIDLPSYASGFYELAADLEPSNALLGVIAFRAVEKADHAKALRRAERIIAAPVSHTPAVVAMSAVMILRREEEEEHEIDREQFANVLNDAIRRLELEPPSPTTAAMVYQLAASGFEVINDPPAALRCYEEGLKLSPDNEVLLIGKGLLLYGSQTEQAVDSFRRAVSNEGSPLVWPYFFLAHYHLLRKEYDESMKMGRQAWARATSDGVRAELLEWQAICGGESGYPPEVVRAQFEKAIHLDPNNERIQKNLEAYGEAIAEQRAAAWDIEEESTLRVERVPSMGELMAVAG